MFLLIATHPSFFEVLRGPLHSLHGLTVSVLILEFHDLFQAILPGRPRLGLFFFTLYRSNYAGLSAIGYMKFSPLLDVIISFALSLPAWISDAYKFPASSMSATKSPRASESSFVSFG